MQRLLITGGTGTVGRAFLRRYGDLYDCYVLGHSEKRLREFLAEFPKAQGRLCSVEDLDSVLGAWHWSDPQIVIHAAAVKHVDFAERQPIFAVQVNVQGSLNVIRACRRYDVKVAVAVSTDKASDPRSVYGYTKRLMERCFLEAGYACTRFGNVAGSAGSVIPLWRSRLARGLPIELTDGRMRRFMFTQSEAADILHRTLKMITTGGDRAFVLTRRMKAIRMTDLAVGVLRQAGSTVAPTIVGPRPGECMDECLLSQDEACRARPLGEYLLVGKSVLDSHQVALTTANAELMDAAEIDTMLREVSE